VSEVAERLDGEFEDPVLASAIRVGDEANAAGVVFEVRIVKRSLRDALNRFRHVQIDPILTSAGGAAKRNLPFLQEITSMNRAGTLILGN
jgi:hypothetical protein